MKISFLKRLKIANLLKNPNNFVLYKGVKCWTLDLLVSDKELVNFLISICKVENIKGGQRGKKRRKINVQKLQK